MKQVSTFIKNSVILAAYAATEKHDAYDHSLDGHFVSCNVVKGMVITMKNDFSTGKVSSRIISQSAPLMLAQLVHLLYNVVDRVYIGHMAAGDMALTGIGLIFPLTSLTGAFINLFSTGGAPLFSIARGAGNEERAARIQSQVMSLLISVGIIITAREFDS